MPNPLVLLPNAVSQPRSPVIYGQVSSQKLAPTSFTSPLYVTQPQWSSDYYWTVTDWPACHGSTLPAQGAACVLVQDTSNALRCIWWDSAVTAFAPTGAAAGDLSGSYPNPTVTTVNGGKTPLSVDASSNSLAAQLLSSHKFYVDDNAGSLYTLNFGNITTGATASLNLTTSRASWTTGLPVGAFQASGYGSWTYAFTAPNTFAITAANPFGVTHAYVWVGVVVGY